jgi:hypothetical protein
MNTKIQILKEGEEEDPHPFPERKRNTQTCLPNKLYTRETPLLLLGVHYSDVMCLKTDEKKRKKKKGQVRSVNIA